MSTPLDLTLCGAADAIAAGDLTCEALVTASLDALGGVGATLNAVVATERDAGLERARALDRVPADRRGRLHGVPLAHKDMYYRAGRVSGSRPSNFAIRRLRWPEFSMEKCSGRP